MKNFLFNIFFLFGECVWDSYGLRVIIQNWLNLFLENDLPILQRFKSRDFRNFQEFRYFKKFPWAGNFLKIKKLFILTNYSEILFLIIITNNISEGFVLPDNFSFIEKQ